MCRAFLMMNRVGMHDALHIGTLGPDAQPLDPLVKHDVLVKQVEELEEPHKTDFEDDASSKPEKKIVKRMK